MFISFLTSWFARSAEGGAPDARLPVHVPARHQPAAVQVEASEAADGIVIRVKGEGRFEGGGALLDGLLSAGHRPAVVTLDLSELRSISCQALAVLAAYRRGVVRTGGRVRLAGVLQPVVKESLVRTKLLDLFEACAAPSAQAPERG